jgi:hypothetical protein
MDEIGRALRGARARGAVATLQVSRVIFGTRHSHLQPYVSPSTQGQGNVSAIGRGLHTVWNGPPRAAQPGEPCLRRARP